MNTLRLCAVLFYLIPLEGRAVEIQPLTHRVVSTDRTFVRDATDSRYSVWTDSEAQIPNLIAALGLPQTGLIELKNGEVFAAFFNDHIEEDFIQVARNSTTKQCFADYADSGIEFKLRPLPKGKKYSNLTVVIFSPPEKPSHLGMRGMTTNGLSEKK